MIGEEMTTETLSDFIEEEKLGIYTISNIPTNKVREFIKKQNELLELLFDGVITTEEFTRRNNNLLGSKLTEDLK